MLLVIDNYDSFTYNLVQYLQAMREEVRTVRNDAIGLDEVAAIRPEAVVISPGPCTPAEAGISVELTRRYSGEIPILGVCLGCQSIAAAFGAEIVHARRIMHGKTSRIEHDGRGVFAGIRSPVTAGRYHSLAVAPESLPGCLEVTARAEDGEIMGIRHRRHPTAGVQFHPESVLTPSGKRLLANFLKLAREWESIDKEDLQNDS
ncbi:MAG: aminodeoxychorismate/anthranilate synthase component II [Kiritimatiellaeota bacterium]|nr:aminodeoxychorismate/anthranilate synthase component II [Kiritimatiellota bacterium]